MDVLKGFSFSIIFIYTLPRLEKIKSRLKQCFATQCSKTSFLTSFGSTRSPQKVSPTKKKGDTRGEQETREKT